MTDPKAAEKTPERNKARERSPNYPALTLTDAIGQVRTLFDKEKRTAVSPEVVAKALGYGSLSGSARSTIASLRQYGLIEGGDHGIRVSDVAIDIIHHAAGTPEHSAALLAAAKKPPLITELAASHADASDDAIRAYLITRKKFSSEGAGRLIAAFRDALKVANLGSPGYTEAEDDGQSRDRVNPPAAGGGSKLPPSKPGERMEFIWPLSGDVVATLTVSRGIEPDDIATLTANFEAAKTALVKAAARGAAVGVANATATPVLVRDKE